MTPEQKSQLLAAVEAGDDIKAVTLSLQIAAWNARVGNRDEAIKIRSLVDDLMKADNAKAKYTQERLNVAKSVLPGIVVSDQFKDLCWPDQVILSLRMADELMEQLTTHPIGE